MAIARSFTHEVTAVMISHAGLGMDVESPEIARCLASWRSLPWRVPLDVAIRRDDRDSRCLRLSALRTGFPGPAYPGCCAMRNHSICVLEHRCTAYIGPV